MHMRYKQATDGLAPARPPCSAAFNRHLAGSHQSYCCCFSVGVARAPPLAAPHPRAVCRGVCLAWVGAPPPAAPAPRECVADGRLGHMPVTMQWQPAIAYTYKLCMCACNAACSIRDLDDEGMHTTQCLQP
jgi:hypothetical protein